MPLYQLPIAAVLAGSAVTSFTAFLATQPTEGKIKLTEGDDEQHDAFDVTKLEDIIDGYPIDEQGFWSRVREEHLCKVEWGSICLTDEVEEGYHYSAARIRPLNSCSVAWMVHCKRQQIRYRRVLPSCRVCALRVAGVCEVCGPECRGSSLGLYHPPHRTAHHRVCAPWCDYNLTGNALHCLDFLSAEGSLVCPGGPLYSNLCDCLYDASGTTSALSCLRHLLGENRRSDYKHRRGQCVWRNRYVLYEAFPHPP